MSNDRSAVRRCDQARGRRLGRRAAAAWLGLLLAAACGPRLDPIEQVRVLSGRPSLAGLPDVPGADRPFPNLGTVPARPVPPSPEERRRVAEALVADRENARHTGPPRPPPGATLLPAAAEAAGPLGFRPEPGGLGGTVAPDPLVVAPSPPPPIAGAPSAAVAVPSREPAAPPAAAASTVTSPPPVPDIPPAPPPTARLEPDAAPIAPPVPAEPRPVSARPAPPVAPSPAPPPPADLLPRAAAGPSAPEPSVIVDRSALPPAAMTVAVRPSASGSGAAIVFARGSANLPPGERDTLLAVARTRGAAGLRVIGFLDAAGEDLGLALARAQAVAQALRAVGVPAEAMEIAAEGRPGPAGRGAEVRLIY
ncbi:MAG: hypothetical protein NZM07_03870 [Elioraea sp.]|nr:hypothetical protein [Elioraea sp.]